MIAKYFYLRASFWLQIRIKDSTVSVDYLRASFWLQIRIKDSTVSVDYLAKLPLTIPSRNVIDPSDFLDDDISDKNIKPPKVILRINTSYIDNTEVSSTKLDLQKGRCKGIRAANTNFICNDYDWVCKHGYYPDEDGLTTLCALVTSSICVNNRCGCYERGTYQNDKQCARAVGYPCKSSTDCDDNSSECLRGICHCKDKFKTVSLTDSDGRRIERCINGTSMFIK
ncbi:unnamed protein product [Didymodactylos carnosus]|uniref:EB domain-containing protein n=1 Tax=Didymodactylos carnosus TaxID=1234261 RepID=A0A815ISG0_9BILA|nr:unnamed protein product [Didymodactylos carnosus]CAF4256219.1 unnamed protein product [Didymodactylos carnosus]